MSFKAKDLTYDDSQPAFLRRLRGELQGESSGRHEQPIPRSKRLKQDNEEDAPAYVLADTNQSLTKEEYEAMMVGEQESNKHEIGTNTVGSEKSVSRVQRQDAIAEVGKAAKKRKAAKLIGDSRADEGNSSKNSSNGQGAKRTKRKGKPVKLSFGEDEG